MSTTNRTNVIASVHIADDIAGPEGNENPTFPIRDTPRENTRRMIPVIPVMPNPGITKISIRIRITPAANRNNSQLPTTSAGGFGGPSSPSSASDGPSSRGTYVTIGSLETAQRKIISVASVSLEVEAVQGAVVSVRNIAESLGGFVDQLSSSGGGESQQATIAIRVPQVQFLNAIESIEALGQVVSSSVSSEAVSEQFIYLEARLKSSLSQEQSLLSLARLSEVSAIE